MTPVTLQHGKLITTQSYYDGTIVSTKHEYEMSILSSKGTILKDIIEAMALISKGETRKLTLDVCIDVKGRYRLIKKWSEL